MVSCFWFLVSGLVFRVGCLEFGIGNLELVIWSLYFFGNQQHYLWHRRLPRSFLPINRDLFHGSKISSHKTFMYFEFSYRRCKIYVQTLKTLANKCFQPLNGYKKLAYPQSHNFSFQPLSLPPLKNHNQNL